MNKLLISAIGAIAMVAIAISGSAQTQSNSTVKTVVYEVKVPSNSAKSKIEREVAKTKGVETVKVSADKKTVTVKYDAKIVNSNDIVSSFKKIGYTATIFNEKEDLKPARPDGEHAQVIESNPQNGETVVVYDIASRGTVNKTLIEREVAKTAGVKEVKVSTDLQTLTVKYDSKKVNTDNIATAVKKLGYTVNISTSKDVVAPQVNSHEELNSPSNFDAQNRTNMQVHIENNTPQNDETVIVYEVTSRKTLNKTKIETDLVKTRGVKEVTVSADCKVITVKYDAKIVSTDGIATEIRKFGCDNVKIKDPKAVPNNNMPLR